MKKKIMAIVLVSGLAAASVASANWGRGNGMGPGYNNMNQGYEYNNQNYASNPMRGQMRGQMMGQRWAAAPQLDEATQEKIEKFFTDNTELRKQIVVKQAERMALMKAETPDAAAVGKLAGELFDLRAEMHAKAIEAGVDQYLGPQGPRGGMGPGMKGGKGGKRGGGRF